MNEWISKVQSILLPRLVGDARLNPGNLITKFDHSVEVWRKNKQPSQIRAVIENANELSAASAILKKLGADDALQYEPTLSGTEKTIDFLVIFFDGKRHWVDVKTIAPEWQDSDASWDRFVKIAEAFPDNARLIVNRELCGGAISGQALKARWNFIRRTAELEAKIALLKPKEQGSSWLLLCSEGAWHPDELEDFADFYRTGKFRQDDWSRNAMARYIADEKIELSRTLSGFHYLERGQADIEARHFRLNVSGPIFT